MIRVSCRAMQQTNKMKFLFSSKLPLFHISNRDGQLIGIKPQKSYYGDYTDISQIQMPFTFKLLTQELLSVIPLNTTWTQ